MLLPRRLPLSTLLRRQHIPSHTPLPQATPNRATFPRAIHTSPPSSKNPSHPLPPAKGYTPLRRPAHNAETPPDTPPPADLEAMDVLGNTPVPASSITACLEDGFAFQNGLRVDGGDGVLIVGGEVVRWRPWLAGGGKGMRFVNAKGQWELTRGVLGVLGVVWPRAGELLFSAVFVGGWG